MKIRNFAAISLLSTAACLPVRTLAERTIALQAPLLNRVDPTGHFPAGATVTVTLTYDEKKTDGLPLNPDLGSYDGALLRASVAVPASGFNRAATKIATQSFRIDRTSPLDKAVVRVGFTLGEFGGADFLKVDAEWFDEPQSLVADSLTADFSPANFRYVQLGFSEAPPGNPIRLAGFAWARPAGLGGPAVGPVLKRGFAEMFVFGDSLSASKVPSGNPGTNYFEGGYSNGPIWVQHLAWRLGIPYREEHNFSEFGGFVLADLKPFADKPLADSLAVFWVNSEVYSAVLSSVFGERLVADTAEAARVEMDSHLALLRAAERAHFLGIRNLLILGVADVSFAPFFQKFLTDPAVRLDLLAFVNAANRRKAAIAADLPAMFKGLRVSFADPNVYLNRLLQNPGLYGITNTTVSALAGAPEKGIPALTDKRFDGPGASYFFWDDISPSTRVHCNLADAIYDDVFALGQPVDDAPGLRLVERNAARTRLYAWNLPVGQPLRLVDSGDLLNFSPVASVIPSDPCRLFDIPNPVGAPVIIPGPPQRFYRLERAVAASSDPASHGGRTSPAGTAVSPHKNMTGK